MKIKILRIILAIKKFLAKEASELHQINQRKKH